MEAKCIGCYSTQQNIMKLNVTVKVTVSVKSELSTSRRLGYNVIALAAGVLSAFETQP